MASINTRAYNLAQDWIHWLDQRKFMGQPPQKNILQALIDRAERSTSDRKRGEPDGIMSVELSAFNSAVMGLGMPHWIPFIVVYCEYRPQPIKAMAQELGIERCQFYERAHNAAARVLGITDNLVAMNRQAALEVFRRSV